MLKPHLNQGTWVYHEIYAGDFTVSFYINKDWPKAQQRLVYKTKEADVIRMDSQGGFD